MGSRLRLMNPQLQFEDCNLINLFTVRVWDWSYRHFWGKFWRLLGLVLGQQNYGPYKGTIWALGRIFHFF